MENENTIQVSVNGHSIYLAVKNWFKDKGEAAIQAAIKTCVDDYINKELKYYIEKNISQLITEESVIRKVKANLDYSLMLSRCGVWKRGEIETIVDNEIKKVKKEKTQLSSDMKKTIQDYLNTYLQEKFK
jgi:hypothetical protein